MENKKNIWIINDYAGSPYQGMEFRHYYLGKELLKYNYNIKIISSSYSHLFKNLPTSKKESIDGICYEWIKTFNYGDAHNKKRVLKWFVFSMKLLKFLFLEKNPPDILIVSTAAPFSIVPSYFLAKKYNAKLIFEVKDIWPLSLVSLGGFKSNHPFIVFMGWFERFALKKSDIIVSNLQNYDNHIRDNVGLNRTFEWISNGVYLDEMTKIELLDDHIYSQLPKDKFIIGYTGTIGIANALDSLLESAKILEDNTNILFVIVGDGQRKKNLLKKYGTSENILFIDSIPKKQVQSMLSLFDICYISAKKEKIYEYGVSPNKLFDYMYSGKPVLYAIDSGKNIIDVANAGLTIESQNAHAIVSGIMELHKMDAYERTKLGSNGKEYVLKHFTYKKLAKKYIEIIER